MPPKGARFINIHGQALPASLVLRILIAILGISIPKLKRAKIKNKKPPRYPFIAKPIRVMMERTISITMVINMDHQNWLLVLTPLKSKAFFQKSL